MSMNFDIYTELRATRDKTNSIEFNCDSICSNFMANHIRYEVTDEVYIKTQSCCAWELKRVLNTKIFEYSF